MHANRKTAQEQREPITLIVTCYTAYKNYITQQTNYIIAT